MLSTEAEDQRGSRRKASMRANNNKLMRPTRLVVLGGIAAGVWSLSLLALAQAPMRGTLSGTVAADQGQVVALRVTAHNLDRRLWYVVFTNKGRYTVPQALPGRYEVTVNEPRFESST